MAITNSSSEEHLKNKNKIGTFANLEFCEIFQIQIYLVAHSFKIFIVLQYFLLSRSYSMDQITIKTSIPKGRIFLNIDLERDLAEGVICLRPPPLLGFCSGYNFVGLESSQKQYTAYNSCMLMLSTQPDPIPHPVTHCKKYTPLYLFTQGRGEERSTSEKVRGALVHKRGRKYHHD
jgi:hypothetical protein